MQTEWIKNLLLARELMESVPEEEVDLGHWFERYPGCGTLACFGGWVALSPLFPQVEQGLDGEPKMTTQDGGKRIGKGVAEELFGDRHMFSCRTYVEDERPGSDKKMALNRIEKRLIELGHEL